jgi:hypothetical protein
MPVEQMTRPALLKETLVEASQVDLALEPVRLSIPRFPPGSGTLTLKKENGVVKGFEYTCVCGHRDHFILE